MTTSLNALAAAEHIADLRRAADHTTHQDSAPSQDLQTVSLRLARPEDTGALHVLAELDEEPELSGDAIVAFADGEAVAALSLDDGRVVSNPFVPTRDAVTLLRIRARHLRDRAPRQPRRRWRPRFA